MTPEEIRARRRELGAELREVNVITQGGESESTNPIAARREALGAKQRAVTASPEGETKPGIGGRIANIPGNIAEFVMGNGEGGPSGLDSFLAGVADTATLGNAPAVLAATSPTRSPMSNLLTGAFNAASNVINPGNPFINADAESERHDAAMQANRGASIAGQIAGALGPGFAASGLVRLASIATKGMPATSFLPKVASYINNTIAGRMAANATLGASEAAVYSRSTESETPLKDVGFGAAVGAAGSLLSDAVGGAARFVTNSAQKTRARRALVEAMRQSAADAELNPAGITDPMGMLAEAQRLGDTALPADVNPGLFNLTLGASQNPDFLTAMRPVTRRFDDRLGVRSPGDSPLGESAMEGFENSIQDLLPSNFGWKGGPDVTGARAKDVAAANSRSYAQSLQADFDAVLDSGFGATPTAVVSDAIKEAFGSVKSQTASVDKALATIMARLDDQVQKAADRGVEAGLDPRAVHTLRVEVSRMLDKELAKSSPDRTKARALTAAKNALSEGLNEIPGFAEVNRKFATEGSYMRAYQLGRDQLSNTRSMSPEQLELWIESAEPGDLAGLMEGSTREIMEHMMKANGEGQLARKITRDDLIFKRLEKMYGEEITEKVVEAAQRALDLVATGARVRSVTRTAENLAMSAQLESNPVKSIFDFGTIASTIAKETGTGAPGASTAASIGAMRRLLQDKPSEQFTSEIGRLLSQQGPTKIRGMLDDLAAVNRDYDPRTLGGLDNLLDELPPDANILDMLKRVDIGSAPAQTAAVAVTGAGSQTQQSRRSREKKRQSRKRRDD